MNSQYRQNNFKFFFIAAFIIAFLWLCGTLYLAHDRYSRLFISAQNNCSELIETLAAPQALNTPQAIVSNHFKIESSITKLSELGLLKQDGFDTGEFWLNKVSPALLAALNNTNEREDDAALLLVTRLQAHLSDNHQSAFNTTAEKARFYASIFIALTLVLLAYLYLTRKYEPRFPVPVPANNDDSDFVGTTESSTLLHRTLPKLAENPESPEALKTLLSEIEHTVNASSSAIFLYKGGSYLSNLLVCSYIKEEDILVSAAENYPDNYISSNLQTHPIFLATYYGNYKIIAIELPYAQENDTKALLLLKVEGELNLNEDHARQLRDHCELLASMIYISLFFKHKLRNVQYEERAAIARELHDSIAQSLSYLKIQASRLQSMVNSDKTRIDHNLDQIDMAVKELRDSISIAYRHLRELLTTFRLTMDGNSFAGAVQDSIKEFEKRCSIVFELDNRLPDGELSVAEEMQLLHIMREALSNVVRHSHAQYTRISLIGDGNGLVSMTIEDDGIGLAAPTDRENHHGLIIMQERTRSIGGTMEIDEREEKGTRVNVTFQSVKKRSTETPNN